MADNRFDSTVEALFKGMDGFLSTKTVVGDAVRFDDGTIILPLVEVSFGVGAGAFNSNGKNNAGGGMGGKITPSSVLVIQNGSARLVNVKNQDTVTKVIDMVPMIRQQPDRYWEYSAFYMQEPVSCLQSVRILWKSSWNVMWN